MRFGPPTIAQGGYPSGVNEPPDPGDRHHSRIARVLAALALAALLAVSARLSWLVLTDRLGS